MSEKLTRAEAARRNGAKSHGPVSVEGKAQSRRNALKHGLSARKVLLTQSEQDSFERQLAVHSAFWSPQSLQQVELVASLARASHRQDRAEAMLLNLLDGEIERMSALENAPAADPVAPSPFEDTYRHLEMHLSRIFYERLDTQQQLKSWITAPVAGA
ncbi:MAG: hypothetical protein JNK87_39880 [Bryobacterales bacterium]|nr:hypothetical protein [Bryobacterales bacterium]